MTTYRGIKMNIKHLIWFNETCWKCVHNLTILLNSGYEQYIRYTAITIKQSDVILRYMLPLWCKRFYSAKKCTSGPRFIKHLRLKKIRFENPMLYCVYFKNNLRRIIEIGTATFHSVAFKIAELIYNCVTLW